MYNHDEISQQLDTLLHSLTTSPAYGGQEDRRLYDFYTLKSKLSTYTYLCFSQKINQIDSLISGTHIVEYHRDLSARLITHKDQALFSDSTIQANISQLYDERYLKTNLDHAIFLTREDSINHILLMQEMDTLLTSIETQDNTELAAALKRYRQIILLFRSDALEIMRSIGLMALVLGLHFTPLTFPFLICEIVAFAILGAELILHVSGYMADMPTNWLQSMQYILMAEIADDIEQRYDLKPPSFCSRFFNCFQGEPPVEERPNHLAVLR